MISATAGESGYGGNATQEIAENAKFKGYVANVSAAQSDNLNTVQQLVARNNVQAGQITHLQQQHQQMMVPMNHPLVMPPNQCEQ